MCTKSESTGELFGHMGARMVFNRTDIYQRWNTSSSIIAWATCTMYRIGEEGIIDHSFMKVIGSSIVYRYRGGQHLVASIFPFMCNGEKVRCILQSWMFGTLVKKLFLQEDMYCGEILTEL